MEEFLEKAWDDLLSREEKKILTRFASLDHTSQQTVLDHLTKMTTEEGWHPEQIKSAHAALDVLTKKDA